VHHLDFNFFWSGFRAGPYGLETVYNTFGLASGQVFLHHLCSNGNFNSFGGRFFVHHLCWGLQFFWSGFRAGLYGLEDIIILTSLALGGGHDFLGFASILLAVKE